jgi:DNA-directed RNA polymerase specialized sigma24 family protein
MRLRARHTDGSHEVVVRGDRHLELVLPDTDPVVFSSKRQLLLALTGHDRHWTFERYFRIGRHAPAAPRSEPAFDLLIEFGEAPSPCTSSTTKSGIVTVKRGGTGKPSALYEAKGSQALVTVSPDTVDAMTCALAVVEGVDDGSGLGIDLVNRSHEVAKLLFAGFGQWIFSANYDPDDVLQEVYKGLLARNRGKCPWDVKKSSFGHYVHMVCRGVLSNYHRKMKRRKEFETTGISGFGDDGQWGKMDAGGTCVVAAKPSDAAEASGLSEAQVALTVFLEGSEKSHTQDGKMAVKVLPMVSIGMTRAEIAEKLGVSRASVSRGLTYLREQSKLWQGASA